MATESAGGPASSMPARRRGRPVSEDLRGRAVTAVLKGDMTAAAAARYFGLGENTVGRFRERGHVRPDKRPGRPSRIEPERKRIFRILEARPEISTEALREALAAEGLAFAIATVRGFLRRRGLQRTRRCKPRTGR